jgi:beta-mannosidase
MTCGPWKPIYLELYHSRISDVTVQTTLDKDLQKAEVHVVLEVEGSAKQASITLQAPGGTLQALTVPVEQNIARASFHLQQPALWWPWTLGSANLYEVEALLYENLGQPQSDPVDNITKRFGIRKIELVQRPLPDTQGASFFFKINNIPIFAGGSCWIPADSFTTRISAQKYRDWIQLARDSNQVMVRIWGGGIYEHEPFYNTCDELGILIWQDFMFACGNYPVHADMQKSVALEANQNVRRLRHHPSIALWCGNNEDYIVPLFKQMTYDADEHDPGAILEAEFPARFFYEHMLPAICTDLSPQTPYWPGSPFGGSMANSHEIGDIHQWHVWHLEKAPYQDYARLAGRFVSEFGMQALPPTNTIRDFFPEGHRPVEGVDLSRDEYVKWHNKMHDGGERMAHYGEPNIPFETQSLPGYIYSTQLIQSEALTTAYSSWRRLWRGEGKEYCGGALVWQLNDCWPVTSWAIADYYLRPKMAYWAVKRECAAITTGVARVKVDGKMTALDAWAVNMTQSDIKVDVSIRAWDVETGELIYQAIVHRQHVLQKNRSTELAHLDLDVLTPGVLSANQKDGGYKAIVFELRLTDPTTAKVVAQKINFHEPLREVPFRATPADLKLQIITDGGDVFVEAVAKLPVKGLLVQSKDDPDGSWDDNGVDLVPDRVVRLRYIGQSLKSGQEHRLQARWLGGQWRGRGSIKHSL